MSREPRLPVRSSALTERQREVLALIARGWTNFQIATEIGVSLETVKYHVTEILTRLNVDSREEAVMVWRLERSATARLRSILLLTTTRVGLAAVVALGATALAVGAVLILRSGVSKESASSPSPVAASTLAAPTEPLRPTPPPGTGPYPIGTRTGIASVDAAIAAVESGDRATLQAAWHFTLSPCAALPPPGGLRCSAGVAAGTGIPVIHVESTDGGALTRDEAISFDTGGALLDRSTVDPRVFAVVDIRGRDTWLWYRIIFTSGHAVDVDDVGITLFECLCQESPSEKLARGLGHPSSTFILPPR